MTEASLSCYTRRDNRSSIAVFEGTLDLATHERAVEFMHSFIKDHGPDVILDASRLDFIDSKGVGVLLGFAKATRDAGGTLYLQNPATPVQKILEMCGLSSLFPPAPAARPEDAPAVPAGTRVAAPGASRPTTRAPRAPRRVA